MQDWYPEWAESPYFKWARKFVGFNLWRVVNVCGTRDDALQECALVFVRCQRRYGHTVAEPRHFMALYKTSVQRRFINLSKLDARHRQVAYGDPPDPVVEYNGGPLAAAVAQMSDECRSVVEIMLEAPNDLVDWLLTDRDKFAGVTPRDVLNRRIWRVCGIRRGTDIMGELENILQP